MSSNKWLALAAWALVPVAAIAQQDHSRYSSSQPAVSGSTPGFQSAFADYRPFGDDSSTPDKVWRAANEEMGVLGGHAGHMKDAPESAAASAPERAAVTRSGSMDHSKHHGGHK